MGTASVAHQGSPVPDRKGLPGIQQYHHLSSRLDSRMGWSKINLWRNNTCAQSSRWSVRTARIIAKISTRLNQHEVNIVDISQNVMEDMFAMVMLVNIDKCTVEFNALADLLDKGTARRWHEMIHTMMLRTYRRDAQNLMEFNVPAGLIERMYRPMARIHPKGRKFRQKLFRDCIKSEALVPDFMKMPAELHLFNARGARWGGAGMKNLLLWI